MVKVDTSQDLISRKAQKFAADELGCRIVDIKIHAVSGGYSRNRRALVNCGDKWIFVKEVDVELLPSDGAEELAWLRKDYELVNALRAKGYKSIPDTNRLSDDRHILLLSAYRSEDGWLWSLPESKDEQRRYIDAIINATNELETVKFEPSQIEAMHLFPYFRDKLALDDGFKLIRTNEAIRDALVYKYNQISKNKKLLHIRKDALEMISLFNNKLRLKNLSLDSKELIKQPNDSFGHCDVRSDNIAYNKFTGEVKFVDWNWASMASSRFGSTEFLVDMTRRGVDIKPWANSVNKQLAAALVGFYAKRCLEDPLSPGNTLRDVQAESAAVAFSLYDQAK